MQQSQMYHVKIACLSYWQQNYIPNDVAKECANERINYLDVAGNCNIGQNNLVLLVKEEKL